MTAAQVYFNFKNKKTSGRCVMCGKETKWNETLEKYDRLCSAECKNKYREDFRKKMIAKYGKEHLLNSEEQQRKMLANRKISGTYIWSDGKSQFPYTGSYEKDFLQFLDKFMDLNPNDIFAPAPQTFRYMDGDKERFYIPDFYIASINTLIEIKDGQDNVNKHYHRVVTDKHKEDLKDELMRKQTQYNYVKVVNKDYSIFLNFLYDLKNEKVKPTECRKPVINISESINMVENLLLTESFTSSLEGEPINEDVIKVDNESVRVPKIIKNQNICKMLDESDNIYLASDWHLWQNIDGRIVKNENFNNIVENCRRLLKENDTLIYLGDLVDDEFNDTTTLKRVLESFNCHKIITLGNNDVLGQEFYNECFDYVVPGFKYGNYLFSHYPLTNISEGINFHGHLHGSGFYKTPYSKHADIYNRYGKCIKLDEAVAKYNRGLYKPRKGIVPPKKEIVNENALFEIMNEEHKQLKDYIDKISNSPYVKDIINLTESTLNIDLSEDSDLFNIIERTKANIRAYTKTGNLSMLKNEACSLWYNFIVLENYAVHPLRKKYVHYDPVQKSNAVKIKASLISELTNVLETINESDTKFDFFKYFDETNYNRELFNETRSIVDAKKLIKELMR